MALVNLGCILHQPLVVAQEELQVTHQTANQLVARPAATAPVYFLHQIQLLAVVFLRKIRTWHFN